MNRALELARQGMGKVSPNPLVGCVLVHQNEVVGEGWHREYGGPHAEVHAIQSVSKPDILEHCTLFVNLEPCAHHGKTPPCTDLILRSGIPKVVIANQDPNPKVSGKGLRILQQAGLEVVVGIEAEKGAFLNRRFFTFHRRKRPYIILKWAETSDGYSARCQPLSSKCCLK